VTTYVWKMHRDSSELLGRIRTEPSLEVYADEDTVWIRCQDASEELQQIFMQLPATHSVATADGQLIERGRRVPQGYLPEGPWIGIAQWMEVTLPVAHLAGHMPRAVPVEMIPDARFETPQLLQTELQTWKQYVASAPRVRLERLAFLVASDGMVLVRGEPLPPLAGKRFVFQGRIAVEAGWAWLPAVSAEVLEAALPLTPGSVAVLYGDGRWYSIAEEEFVQATRSAVRAMSEGLGFVS